MIARRVIVLALAYIAGIVAAMALRTDVAMPLLVLAIAVGAALLVWTLRRDLRWAEMHWAAVVLPPLLLGLSAGYWRTMHETAAARPGSLAYELAAVEDRATLSLEGRLVAEPELRRRDRGDLQLRADRMRVGAGPWREVEPGRVQISLRLPRTNKPAVVARFHEAMDPEAYGYRVRVSGRYRDMEPRLNPGDFDVEAFYAQRGLLTRLQVSAMDFEVLAKTRGNPMTEFALDAKRRFLLTYRESIRAPASQLVAAATLGVRRAVEGLDYRGEPVVDTFRHAGVGHVLAVSGLHVSVIALLLYVMFRALGMRPRVLAPFVILCLIAFALLTGARPSSVRAVIMNSVILVAVAYFRCNFRIATYVGLSASSLLILAGNPLILVAPSFLLSYGAVLALVLLAPPVDRWMRRLRGFALVFGLGWLAALLLIAAVELEVFLSAWNVLGLFGGLWLLVMIGGRLNDCVPPMWKLGLERIPDGLRMFLSAQIAIQVGMMIPLSAWFFGQFPVAGALVNLFAIPLIGVLVQLGMLTGLAGVVPVLGPWLAMPFGAAVTLVGESFLAIAHYGAQIFPFPATPQPTLAWMGAYVAALLGLIWLERRRMKILGLLYAGAARVGRGAVALPWLAALLLAALPLRHLVTSSDPAATLTCYAGGRYPLVACVTEGGRAALLNAGGSWDARMLFDALRQKGATRIDAAYLPSTAPGAGTEGLAALLERMDIRRCVAAVAPAAPADYLTEIGDTYLARKAADGERWATAYTLAYASLLDALREHDVALEAVADLALDGFPAWSIRSLPPQGPLPSRFVSTAVTPLVAMDFAGSRWLVVTDSTPEMLTRILEAEGREYDVLVLPELSSRRAYAELVTQALALSTARVVIVSGDRAPSSFDVATLLPEGLTLFRTWEDGAVTARRTPDGVTLQAFASGRSVDL